jgi:hypothetical protein
MDARILFNPSVDGYIRFVDSDPAAPFEFSVAGDLNPELVEVNLRSPRFVVHAPQGGYGVQAVVGHGGGVHVAGGGETWRPVLFPVATSWPMGPLCTYKSIGGLGMKSSGSFATFGAAVLVGLSTLSAVTPEAGATPAPAPAARSVPPPAPWLPCPSNTYQIGGGTRSQVAAVKSAFAQAAKASSLEFTYVGRTKVVPKYPELQRDTTSDITVVFAAPGTSARRSNLITSKDPFVWYQVTAPSLEGTKAYGGIIVYNSPVLSKMTSKARVDVYLHSIGHMLGLANSKGVSVMNPNRATRRFYSVRDKAALARVGRKPSDCAPGSGQPGAPELPSIAIEAPTNLQVVPGPNRTLTVSFDPPPSASSSTRYYVTVSPIVDRGPGSFALEVVYFPATSYTFTDIDFEFMDTGEPAYASVRAIDEYAGPSALTYVYMPSP